MGKGTQRNRTGNGRELEESVEERYRGSFAQG